MAAMMRCILILATVALAVNAELIEHFIAAEYVDWDFAPSGMDLCRGMPLDDDASKTWTTVGIGTRYRKARFLAYPDDDWDAPLPRLAEEEHLGILGPLIRVAVGDTLRVHFINRLNHPANMAIPGLTIDRPDSTDFTVQPNKTAVWTWKVPEAAGPLPEDPGSKLWVYKSTIQPTHQGLGLVGPVLVTGKGRKADALDQEFVTLFQVFDEQSSPLLDDNLMAAGIECVSPGTDTNGDAGHPQGHARHLLEAEGDMMCFKGLDVSAISPVAAAQLVASNASAEGPWASVLTLAELEESNKKHTINGLLFCNVPGLNMSMKDTIRWHTAVVGDQVDLHTPHWHGLTFAHHGASTDEVLLLPGGVATVETVVDSPGTWLLHCHVNDHIVAGMSALFSVDGPPLTDAALQLDGRERVFYIAAEPIQWDYAPTGADLCRGDAQPFTAEQSVFVEAGPLRFGSTYIKARYVQYTDDRYTTAVPRSDDEEHLGLLGPLLRAEVGDTVVIHLVNNLDVPVSMHTHGALYNKSSEGTPYADGEGANPGAAVPPGGRHTYVWKIPDRAAPGPAEGSSKLWMYHSHTHEVEDTYAGLVGGMVVTARGMADEEGRPKDVDREYALLFMVSNEQLSSLFDANLAALVGGTQGPNVSALLQDEDFKESNLMHSINGYVYCNLPGLTAQPNERVRLYVMGLGTEVDLHTPSLRTATFNLSQNTAQVVPLLPGVMRTADVLTSIPGTFLLQCNVFDHITAGMSAALIVQGSPAQTTAPPTRTLYIAAEPIDWNYLPLGGPACTRVWSSDRPHDNDQQMGASLVNTDNATTHVLGMTVRKAVYRAYTDEGFGRQAPRAPQEGLLGPTIRVAVGERLRVVLVNRLDFEVNMVIGGGLVPASNATIDASDAAAQGVLPGERVVYEWSVPSSVLDMETNDQWVAFTYGSTVDATAHTYAGLHGLVLVSKQPLKEDVAALGSSLSSRDVDVEMPLVMMNIDEQASPFFEANLEAAGLTEDQLEPGATVLHAINGFLFCNAPPLKLRLGGTSRWLLASLGSESDLHTPEFLQQLLLEEGRAIPTVELLPAVTKVVTVKATTPGSWEVHCAVTHHMEQGMRMRLEVV